MAGTGQQVWEEAGVGRAWGAEPHGAGGMSRAQPLSIGNRCTVHTS